MTSIPQELQPLLPILRLALESPYLGERQKAARLLLGKLSQTPFQLSDLESRFAGDAGQQEFLRLTGLPYTLDQAFRSPEEALYYAGILTHLGGQCQLGQSNTLHCQASAELYQQAANTFEASRERLQTRLLAAQRQAAQEYQTRRKTLFAAVLDDMLANLP